MLTETKQNRAVIVCGSPGAGKSTYGKNLAMESRACLLDIDTCTEQLVRVGLREHGHDQNDRDSEYFKRTYREPIYATLFSIARENLPFTDVIVVGPFTREIRDIDWPAKLKVKLGVLVEVHYVYCSPERRRERIVSRAEGRDLSKLADWENSKKYFGSEARPDFQHVYIDTTACEHQGKTAEGCVI